MIDPFEYEARLQARLTAHAARAARPFDAAAIAASAAAGSPRDGVTRQFGRLLAGRNGHISATRVALVGLLLLAAVGAGTILIGSVFQPRPPLPVPLVEIGPSNSPSALASIGPTDVAIRGSWVANALPVPSLRNGAGPVSLAIDPAGDRLSVANFAPGAGFASTTEQVAADQIRLTLDRDSGGCSAGVEGRYRWAMSPEGLLLTLAPVIDPCVSRGEALGRTWARSLVGTSTRGAGVVDTMVPTFAVTLPDDTYESRTLDDFIEIGGSKGLTTLLVFKNPQGFEDPCSTDEVRYPYTPGAAAFVDFYRQNLAYRVESVSPIQLDGHDAIHFVVKIRADGPCPSSELYTWTPRDCACHFLGADDSIYLIDVGSDTFMFLLSPSPDQATEARVMDSIRIPYEVPSR
jgi:hypothetical protein